MRSKPKPIAPCTRDFSRASSKLQLIATNCDWFIAPFVPVMIGRSNCFGFGFSTVIWKPLYSCVIASAFVLFCLQTHLITTGVPQFWDILWKWRIPQRKVRFLKIFPIFFLCGRKELAWYGFIVAWMEYNICFSLFDFNIFFCLHCRIQRNSPSCWQYLHSGRTSSWKNVCFQSEGKKWSWGKNC